MIPSGTTAVKLEFHDLQNQNVVSRIQEGAIFTLECMHCKQFQHTSCMDRTVDTYLMYMNPRPRMYGESLCVIRPMTCFLVSFKVNNLYSKQKALDTIPPAPTPRTCKVTWQKASNLYTKHGTQSLLLNILRMNSNTTQQEQFAQWALGMTPLALTPNTRTVMTHYGLLVQQAVNTIPYVKTRCTSTGAKGEQLLQYALLDIIPSA